MDSGRAEQGPVANSKEENASTSVEDIITNAVLFVDARAGRSSNVGRGSSQGNGKTHESSVPDLAPQAPVEGIVGRLGWLGDEHNAVVLLQQAIGRIAAGGLVDEDASRAREHFVDVDDSWEGLNGHPKRLSLPGGGFEINRRGERERRIGSREPHAVAPKGDDDERKKKGRREAKE